MNQQKPDDFPGISPKSPKVPTQWASGPVLGPSFYASVLADRVISECHEDPRNVPVVNLHLFTAPRSAVLVSMSRKLLPD